MIELKTYKYEILGKDILDKPIRKEGTVTAKDYHSARSLAMQEMNPHTDVKNPQVVDLSLDDSSEDSLDTEWQ